MLTLNQFNESILPFTLKHEGGYNLIPGDLGGETYQGISRENNRNWVGWFTIDRKKPLKYNQILPELDSEVKNYYWQRFVNNAYDKLNSAKVGLAMFDYNFNGGFNLDVMRSIIKSKFGKDVPTNGVISWVNTQDENKIADAILAHRENYYKIVIAKNPSQKIFEKGWSARLESLKSAIKNIKTVGISAGVLIIILLAIYFIFIRKDKSNENQQFIETNPGEMGENRHEPSSSFGSN